MAFLLDLKWGGRFYDTFSLAPYSDDDADRMRRWVRYEKEKETENLIKLTQAGRHIFELRKIEQPVPDDMVARSLTLTKGKSLPDYVHAFLHGKLVSSRLHDAIVDLEAPGKGFNMHPVEIYHADGSQYPEQYYFWDVFRKVDATDPDCEGIKTVAGPADGTHLWTLASRPTPPTREHLAVRKNVISDFVAWRDFRHGDGYYFICDALYHRMVDDNMTGFSAKTEWSET